MATWIETPGIQREAWGTLHEMYDLHRGHTLDLEWINLATGARVALVQDNGRFENANGTHFFAKLRLFHRDASDSVAELTNVVLSHINDVPVPRRGPAEGVCEQIQERCAAAVRDLLGDVYHSAHQPHEEESDALPQRSHQPNRANRGGRKQRGNNTDERQQHIHAVNG